MAYMKASFIPFRSDSGQVIANLEAAYDQWHQARQAMASFPSSMFWQPKGGTDYLAVKVGSYDSATTRGSRSPETEAVYESFVAEKETNKKRVAEAGVLIEQRAQQYRALRLPVMLDKQGELLRALDVEGLLRNDLLVVGTNAFAAYGTAPRGSPIRLSAGMPSCACSRRAIAMVSGRRLASTS